MNHSMVEQNIIRLNEKICQAAEVDDVKKIDRLMKLRAKYYPKVEYERRICLIERLAGMGKTKATIYFLNYGNISFMREYGANVAVEAAIVGGHKETLEQLLPILQDVDNPIFVMIIILFFKRAQECTPDFLPILYAFFKKTLFVQYQSYLQDFFQYYLRDYLEEHLQRVGLWERFAEDFNIQNQPKEIPFEFSLSDDPSEEVLEEKSVDFEDDFINNHEHEDVLLSSHKEVKNISVPISKSYAENPAPNGSKRFKLSHENPSFRYGDSFD